MLELNELLAASVSAVGESRVAAELQKLAQEQIQPEDILTVVANEGVHALPEWCRRGHVFVAHAGDMDFSTPDSVLNEYRAVLSGVARVLKSRPWKKVFLLPFGHTTLSMQIKLLVYRVTHIETVDVMYVGNGSYFDLEIAQRSIIAAQP